jgi:hypothetical protein
MTFTLEQVGALAVVALFLMALRVLSRRPSRQRHTIEIDLRH